MEISWDWKLSDNLDFDDYENISYIGYLKRSDNTFLTWIEVIEGWIDGSLSYLFSYDLLCHHLSACFLECNQISENDPFICSISYSEELSILKKADPKPFTSQLKTSKQFTSFINLSKDAVLVIPTKSSLNLELNDISYAHFSSFLRKCDEKTLNKFWAFVGTTVFDLIKKKNIFLSTSGLGVSFLHVRISEKPKYYRNLEKLKESAEFFQRNTIKKYN